MSNEKIMIDEAKTQAAAEVSEDVIEQKTELSEEELMDFYLENQDAIDLMGGLEMFESLMALDEEQFTILKPQIFSVFEETVDTPEARQELQLLAISQNYTSETLAEEFAIAIEAIDTIDFLSEAKKDFLKEIYSLMSNKLAAIIGHPTVRIPCELSESVSLPTYVHDSDAGMDIYSPDEYTIAPGETVIIPTGIKVAIPKGYALLIQPRSGQSAKTKLRIANTPGLIDSGYRDEIGVIVENIEPPFKDIDYEFDDKGEIHIKSILHGEAYTIAPGQRFAQMRLVQVPKVDFIQVESVGEIGEDRGGGFGSTDIIGEN